jgi:feruloyl esterase
MLRSYLSIGVLILVPSLGHGQTVSSQRCERLASLTLPNTAITMAEVNTSGTFVPSGVTAAPNANLTNLPPFCRVAATLKPAAGSDIKIEVWLPASGWNGKFMAVGNGGLAGSITYTAGSGGIERGMAEALKRGYATASTDTGHTGDTAAPFLENRVMGQSQNDLDAWV